MHKIIVNLTAILCLTGAVAANAAEVMVCKQKMLLRELNRKTTLLCDDIGKKKLHELYGSGWRADQVISEGGGKNTLLVFVMSK
jgi:hypothetical protein